MKSFAVVFFWTIVISSFLASCGSISTLIDEQHVSCKPFSLYVEHAESQSLKYVEAGYMLTLSPLKQSSRIHINCFNRNMPILQWEFDDNEWFALHDDDPSTPYEVFLRSTQTSLSWLSSFNANDDNDDVSIMFRIASTSLGDLFDVCKCSITQDAEIMDQPSGKKTTQSTVLPVHILPAHSYHTLILDRAVRPEVHQLPMMHPFQPSTVEPSFSPSKTSAIFLEVDIGLEDTTGVDTAAQFIMSTLVDGIMPNAVLRAARKAHDVLENYVAADLVDMLAGGTDRQGMDEDHPCFKQGEEGGDTSFLELRSKTYARSGTSEGGSEGEDMPSNDDLECPPEPFQASKDEWKKPGLIAHRVARNIMAVAPLVIKEMTEQAFASLATDLHPILTQRLRAPLAHDTAHWLVQHTGDLTAVSANEAVRAAVARTLPVYLLRSLTHTLTHGTTRAVTHALTATLAHSLASSPQHEGACYVCAQRSVYCDECYADDELRTRAHVRGYYRHFYASFYGDYYAGYYVNNGPWHAGSFMNDGTHALHDYASEHEDIASASTVPERPEPIRVRPPVLGPRAAGDAEVETAG